MPIPSSGGAASSTPLPAPPDDRSTATLNGGWTGFRAVNGDDAAANTAATDLINILDAIEVPIVVLRRDLMIAGFNKAAADVLRLSPSDIGRASRDISVLAGLPVWKSNAARSSQAEWNPGPIFATGISGSLCGYPPTHKGDRRVTGAVLTFTNVTAFRACIDQVIYERECTKAILNTVADPIVGAQR